MLRQHGIDPASTEGGINSVGALIRHYVLGRDEMIRFLMMLLALTTLCQVSNAADDPQGNENSPRIESSRPRSREAAERLRRFRQQAADRQEAAEFEPVKQQPIRGPKPEASVVANEVDRLLNEAFISEAVTPADLTKDETFLRRVTLDLAGTIPTSNEVTLFSLDPDPNKRANKIESLLASVEFAQNWGGFFRELVYSRATDPRSRTTQMKFEQWLVEQLKANRPWDEITKEILTATGSTREVGQTAFMFAHEGKAEELAGETARIFLGMQLQCANCHDHPYDSWKREQFHELAAYFPRVQVRRDGQGSREFIVSSNDASERQEAMRDRFTPEQSFGFLDRNKDGKISAAEGKQGAFASRFDRILENGDTDKDKAISLAEFKVVMDRINNAGPGRGSSEHYMQDLEDPQSRGTKTQPVFFINDNTVPYGTDDLDRRGALADSITDPANEWFAKAFVNRVWHEMFGESFYPVVDDIGPERTADHPEVLNILAKGFTQSRYDVQWLFQAIVLTQAYQRQLGERQPGDPGIKFAAAVPVRLHSDQIYQATKQVLGVEGLVSRGGGRGMMAGDNARYFAGMDPARIAFFQLFNYDPSTPQDEVLGNVPQALFMMNSQLLAGLESGRGFTILGRILRDNSEDSDALSELYLRTLSRDPSKAEQEICNEHIRTCNNRQEAYEDILWSLLNSSEFLTKR